MRCRTQLRTGLKIVFSAIIATAILRHLILRLSGKMFGQHQAVGTCVCNKNIRSQYQTCSTYNLNLNMNLNTETLDFASVGENVRQHQAVGTCIQCM